MWGRYFNSRYLITEVLKNSQSSLNGLSDFSICTGATYGYDHDVNLYILTTDTISGFPHTSSVFSHLSLARIESQSSPLPLNWLNENLHGTAYKYEQKIWRLVNLRSPYKPHVDSNNDIASLLQYPTLIRTYANTPFISSINYEV